MSGRWIGAIPSPIVKISIPFSSLLFSAEWKEIISEEVVIIPSVNNIILLPKPTPLLFDSSWRATYQPDPIPLSYPA
jgi:hypothetical protein